MDRTDQPSWVISTDQPQSLAIGLFIRDVASVPSRHGWLPPAAPVVPRSGDQAPEVAGAQWDDWWDEAFRRQCHAGDGHWPPDARFWWTPPAFEALDAAPQLQAIVAAHFFDAVRWSNDRHQEHVAMMHSSVGGLFATRLVKSMERALARPAQPFSLRVTQIPVCGEQLWLLRPDHVVVSVDLLRDTARYQKRLTPVVAALF